MTCDLCAKARAGIWGTWVDGCVECRARSVARCMAAFHALDPIGDGDKRALVETIGRALPEVPYAEARRMVYAWWQSDHGITEGETVHG